MPDKPKRRKNKNKRKNKTNRADQNKNNNIEVVLDNSCEGSSSITIDQETSNELKHNHQSISGSEENNSGKKCNNEDFNNNRSIKSHDISQNQDTKSTESSSDEQKLYIVESPEQSSQGKTKLKTTFKSKSLDHEDEDPKIVEVTDDVGSQVEDETTLAIVDTNNVLITDVESDVEWEKTSELEDPELSKKDMIESLTITSLPLNIAQCQQTNSLSPDVEASLRDYLATLNLSSSSEIPNSAEIKEEIEQIINREVRQRLRKKGLAEDIVMQRLGPPRVLDVIDEEGSSESSVTSRRQSYLSDKKSDYEDLEDDVFEDVTRKNKQITKKTDTICPKKSFGRLVPQECKLVGAKLKDSDVTEARGDWTVRTVEKLTGAEVVYLTDSSSTSSLHDCGDETDDGADTDISVRMITPTIEVTDTESLLKKTFVKDVESPSKSISSETLNTSLQNNAISSENDIHDMNQEYCSDAVSTNAHEIIVLSTNDIKTDLYVKDVSPETNSIQDKNDKYDLEIKVLKCELNNAINNLIKEVTDTETNETNEVFTRQDSSSSICSSQCTAKYNPTSSSLNDVSNILHDENTDLKNPCVQISPPSSANSHVKEVFQHVTGETAQSNDLIESVKSPANLRDLCVKRVASFPYGQKILEELASVSKRLQNIAGVVSAEGTSLDSYTDTEQSKDLKMPHYPLPDISPIEQIIVPSAKEVKAPPVKPRNSSLKRMSREEETWTAVPTNTEPVYVCLSPSQKMLMEKTNTVITKEKATELSDMHSKFVHRRGYDESFTKERQKNELETDISPIVPFKSQTGSRLLALIRDPTLTNNVNSINRSTNSDLSEKDKEKRSALHNFNNFDNRNIFKPIPPPKPKKLSSTYYESDESSYFTDSSLRSVKSDRKLFHFSTGNLSKEIEDDISSIQNMHRYNMQKKLKTNDSPRRPSLPKDLCDQQMEYILRKEKEVAAEIERLESLRNKVSSSTENIKPHLEKETISERLKDANDFFMSRRKKFSSSSSSNIFDNKDSVNRDRDSKENKLSSLFSSSQEELLREKMYSEYVSQMAQREERKHHKVIKITNTPIANSNISKSLSAIDVLDSKVNNRIEKEFICKARDRWNKLGIKDPETEDERENSKDIYREPKVIEHKIKVIEAGEEKDMKNLPSHLQEFVRFRAKDQHQSADQSGESESEPAAPHVLLCAVIIIVLTIGNFLIRLIKHK